MKGSERTQQNQKSVYEINLRDVFVVQLELGLEY